MGAPKLYWFEARSCWRFPFRDPRDGKRRFLFCTPGKFRVADIDLDSEDVVRRKSNVSEGLARRLQTRFLNSLACWEPEPDDHGMGSTVTSELMWLVEDKILDPIVEQTGGYYVARIRGEVGAIVGIADATNRVAHGLLYTFRRQGRRRGIVVRGDFTAQDHEIRRDQGLDGHAYGWVVFDQTVQKGVGNLVRDFIRVSHRHGFGRE